MKERIIQQIKKVSGTELLTYKFVREHFVIEPSEQNVYDFYYDGLRIPVQYGEKTTWHSDGLWNEYPTTRVFRKIVFKYNGVVYVTTAKKVVYIYFCGDIPKNKLVHSRDRGMDPDNIALSNLYIKKSPIR